MTNNRVVKVGQVRCYNGYEYRVLRVRENTVLTYWWDNDGTMSFSYNSVAGDPVMSEAEVNDFLISLNRFN